MIVFKNIMRFLLSLRTAIWLLIFILALFFVGAFIMPVKEEYMSMSTIPLFKWLREQPIDITWWVFGSIGVLLFLSLNTIFCSIESLIKKRKVTRYLLLISPQIIHVGFLFMLFAHLLDAIGGSKYLIPVREGIVLRLTDDRVLRIKDIDISIDSSGYIRDWKVEVEDIYGRNDKNDAIRPNKPFINKGLNVNVKDLRVFPHEAVLLQISREPGAVWALAGGILFIIGITILILFKIRMEDNLQNTGIGRG